MVAGESTQSSVGMPARAGESLENSGVLFIYEHTTPLPLTQ